MSASRLYNACYYKLMVNELVQFPFQLKLKVLHFLADQELLEMVGFSCQMVGPN